MYTMYVNAAARKPRIARAAACLIIVVLLLAAGAFLSVDSASASSSFDPHEQVGHQQHGGSSVDDEGGSDFVQALYPIVRVLYYIAFMLSAGLLLWSVAEPSERSRAHVERLDKWRLYAMRGLLVVVLLYVFFSYQNIVRGYDSSAAELLRIFTDTRMGHSWLALLILSLLGFIALRMESSYKALWALLLAAAESYNGHVLALDHATFAIVLDYIHLVGAALWAGGLMLLLLLWFKERDEAIRFVGKFSRFAWISIIVLSLSGVLITVLMLPSWTYLLYTTWGVLLLLKTALVLAVIGTGYALRRSIKVGQLPSGSLIKLDGMLMAAILIIVSVFTYLSPEPHTEPFSHHQMGDSLHYTVDITPNGPGPNEASVKIWLIEELGEPQSVKLTITAADRPRKAPIEVKLEQVAADQAFDFPGFTETNYRSDTFTLPFPGPWIAELVVIDKNGKEFVNSLSFSND